MLLEKEPVTEIKVTGSCYTLMVQRKEGEDITIPTEATKVREEKKDISVVQENISSLGTIWLMTTRRRWTDNKPFQARQWRKIVHIFERICCKKRKAPSSHEKSGDHTTIGRLSGDAKLQSRKLSREQDWR